MDGHEGHSAVSIRHNSNSRALLFISFMSVVTLVTLVTSVTLLTRFVRLLPPSGNAELVPSQCRLVMCHCRVSAGCHDCRSRADYALTDQILLRICKIANQGRSMKNSSDQLAAGIRLEIFTGDRKFPAKSKRAENLKDITKEHLEQASPFIMFYDRV